MCFEDSCEVLDHERVVLRARSRVDTMLNIKKFFVINSKNASVIISSVLLSGSGSSFNVPMYTSMPWSSGMLLY